MVLLLPLRMVLLLPLLWHPWENKPLHALLRVFGTVYTNPKFILMAQ
jgi:hypothetical protein